MDNDFMKHLEHGQVNTSVQLVSILIVGLIFFQTDPFVGRLVQILTIMDCMYPTSLAKGCCVIQEGDDGSTVYVLEGKAPRGMGGGGGQSGWDECPWNLSPSQDQGKTVHNR